MAASATGSGDRIISVTVGREVLRKGNDAIAEDMYLK
jgi:hypothetical protein